MLETIVQTMLGDMLLTSVQELCTEIALVTVTCLGSSMIILEPAGIPPATVLLNLNSDSVKVYSVFLVILLKRNYIALGVKN